MDVTPARDCLPRACILFWPLPDSPESSGNGAAPKRGPPLKAKPFSVASLLEASENNLYFGRVHMAQHELTAGNYGDAIRVLDACRPQPDG